MANQPLVQKTVEWWDDFGKKFYFFQISTKYTPFDSALNEDSEPEIFSEKFSHP